jgi:cephalosporin-C deacetylase-like acetyl esterase
MAISRRRFIQATTAAVGAGTAGRLPAAGLLPNGGPASGVSGAAPDTARQFSISIRGYLSREARRMTDRALADYSDAATWKRLLPERRRQYLEMMGMDVVLAGPQRPPLNVKVTGVVERPQYRIEKLYYESLPKLYVTGNLYVPKNLTARAPGVLYVCGHSPTQKVHYQAHPRRFAELGFVCLAVDTVQLGEARGYHHGPYYEGWFHWYSRGYTSAGIECLNGIRGLDLLSERAEVEASRLGITGISGGGAASWWVAAADERIKAAAPVCGTATLASHIADLTVDGHCDCMWWNNIYGWDLADLGALIAPRALMIASADHDPIFTIDAIREVHTQVERIYATLGASQNLRLVTTPGGHGYHQRSRKEILAWFLRHLQGKAVPPSEIGDIELDSAKLESEATLRVYVNGGPADNRVPTIQDTLIAVASPPEIADTTSHAKARNRIIAELREKSFRAFPQSPPPLDTQVECEFAPDNGSQGARFAFTSEEGWRLRGGWTVREPARTPAPAVVALRSPGERRPDGTAGESEEFLGRLQVPWAKVIVEPRGTGETAWSDQLNWHLRRASAWTGRTLASMWVWDALRALEAVRSLPHIDARHVSLAARGDMCAVALYVALLDGHVSPIFLQNPPATQNAPSQRDGRGAAIEMLNCLRITDLPYVAGLLHPTEVVLVGDVPPTYDWAEEVYRRLDSAAKFKRVADPLGWKSA